MEFKHLEEEEGRMEKGYKEVAKFYGEPNAKPEEFFGVVNAFITAFQVRGKERGRERGREEEGRGERKEDEERERG